MLEIRGLDVAYGESQVLWDVSLDVPAGSVVCLMGRNGVGKTTLLKSIMGLLPVRSGRVAFDGCDLGGRRPEERAACGIGYVPQGREIFPNLTVRENLELGSYRRARANRARNFERVLDGLPRLRERLEQPAGTLSGGEQQMLATGRGLMAEPKLLILDEPSLGLSPLMVEDMFRMIQRISGEGVTVLLVEQNVVQSLDIAHRAYVMENGVFVLSGPARELAADPRLKQAYLGL
jgi:branched-chain amino acid transport system ATP-binding protein